jgi:integrase
LSEIEVAIAQNTWKLLKKELSSTGKAREKDMTVRQFSELYLRDYCAVYNRRPDFKQQALSSIVRILGHVRICDFDRSNADHFVSIRIRQVASATVNRGIAVLKNMMSFAVSQGYIEANPLTGFGKLPEEEAPLRIMTLEEEHRLISEIANIDPLTGAYSGLLGETGLRKSEGLQLRWSDVDFRKRFLTVARSKTARPRYIPLSASGLEWLMSIPRHEGSAWVFTRANGRRINDPRGPFQKGRDAADLNWVRGFHDLRHFRATLWLQNGVDIYTVSRYLGHRRIETTRRYLHFVEDYAERSVRKAQDLERKMLLRSGRHVGDIRTG